MPDRVKTAVLISGRGSNMVSLVHASRQPEFPAEIVLVISNRPDAAGLEKAREMGIEAVCINHRRFKNRRNFESKLHAVLEKHGIELVCCAGFMRVLAARFTRKWTGRMLNIHPSLLPKYKGLNTHQRALDAGDQEAGCTVHYVTEELDSGGVIEQARVNVLPSDTAETLAARVLEKEYIIYPKALQRVAASLRASR